MQINFNDVIFATQQPPNLRVAEGQFNLSTQNRLIVLSDE